MYLGGNPGTRRTGNTVAQGASSTTSDPWAVKDDYDTFESQHITLTPGLDTTVTFTAEVALVHVYNWDTTNRLLVKDGAISSNTDTTASRIGKSPAADLPNDDWFPFKTLSIHVRSAAGNEITVVGYRR